METKNFLFDGNFRVAEENLLSTRSSLIFDNALISPRENVEMRRFRSPSPLSLSLVAIGSPLLHRHVSGLPTHAPNKSSVSAVSRNVLPQLCRASREHDRDRSDLPRAGCSAEDSPSYPASLHPAVIAPNDRTLRHSRSIAVPPSRVCARAHTHMRRKSPCALRISNIPLKEIPAARSVRAPSRVRVRVLRLMHRSTPALSYSSSCHPTATRACRKWQRDARLMRLTGQPVALDDAVVEREWCH